MGWKLHLVFLSLHFCSLLRRSIASDDSDFTNLSITSGSRRHVLADESNLSLEEHLQKLEKLSRGYMTNSELEKAIMEFNRRCSSISRVYSIGKSVQGHPLWVIELSDKPGVQEAEPAFKVSKEQEKMLLAAKRCSIVLGYSQLNNLQFIGNVHGDEPVGRELLMLLANWICDNYMKDPLATLIVDNVHLHILPSMNPDGFKTRRRVNANNIDLNRDFPDQFFPMNDDLGSRQPETKAIMSWMEEIHFTASASLHGGALVANFPWDGTQDKKKYYFACPDDETFRYMANLYSHYHHNMSLSQEFPEGITNGAYWYPIYGGMQDWNYIHAGCFELTLEISDDKWPNATELPILWEYNKLSMLHLVASVVKSGIHGRIFSSDSGKPIPASIDIIGINYTIKAGETFADYHRLLAPGENYEVIATMTGYKPKRTQIVLKEEAMSLDFILDPVIAANADGLLLKGWDYSFLRWWQSNLFVILMLILAFLLCIFLKKSRVLNRSKHRPNGGSKRPSLV